MIVDETNNIARCIEIPDATERYDLRWLSMTQTTVADGGLSEKPDERYDLLWLSVKQTIDHDGSKPVKANEINDHGWLLMERLTNHDEFLPKKPNRWLDYVWLSMEETTNNDECFLGTQMKEKNLHQNRWNKWLVMIDAHS